MSFIIYNPQKSVLLGLTVFNWLNKNKWPIKYYFLTEYIKNNKAIIFCDNYGTSFPFEINKTLYSILKYLEIYIWLIINRINPFNVRVIFDKKKLSHEDYLFFFSSDFLQKVPHPYDGVLTFKAHKLIHFSHYFFRTRELYMHIMDRKDITLIAENNLFKNSSYFQHYFPKWEKSVYLLPFCVNQRFKNNINFIERENRCLAVGSFMTMVKAEHNSCMLDYYESDTIHPIRKEIYVERENLIKEIECKISYVNEFWNLKTVSEKGRFRRIQELKNLYFKKIKNNWGKSGHFKTDIVKAYNSYKMVFSSDDSGDLPSISFFEAMLCGCACFAIPGKKFRDLGLIEDVHYLSFDGTLSSLLDRIKFYQKNQNEMEIIARNGEKFAQVAFTESRISSLFLEDISKGLKNSSFLDDH